LCSEYPCQRYREPSPVDSFISYKEVLNNLALAKQDTDKYLGQLKIRYQYLCELLNHFDDGRSKGLYCLAMNNLPLPGIEAVMNEVKGNADLFSMSLKERAGKAVALFKARAEESGIELLLRK